MTIKFYGYDKCSTCRKAQTLLNSKKRAYEAIDITQLPPSVDELESMIPVVGGDLRRLFNSSGVVYREMKLGDKLASMSSANALKLLATNGRLIKRPFLIINGKGAAVGFNADEWDRLF